MESNQNKDQRIIFFRIKIQLNFVNRKSKIKKKLIKELKISSRNQIDLIQFEI